MSFSHPTCLVINKAASQNYQMVGDGVSTFIVVCSEVFQKSFKYIQGGANVQNIVEGIKIGVQEFNKYLQSVKKPFESDSMYKLTLTSLKTKLKPRIAENIAKIAVDSFNSIYKNSTRSPGLELLEIIEMGESNASETQFVDGLVLDHGNRHPKMPTSLENVAIIISNISLEYEKVEINAGFYYKSADQRQDLAENERMHIINRANRIVEFAEQLKKQTGKNVVFITDKGIDPFSLEILAKANILGLRRAKRRNLERLLRMCGGNLINSVQDLKPDNLGVCRKISIKNIKDEKYTFIEGTPFHQSCTVLVRGNDKYEMKRITSAIKGAHLSLLLASKSPFYLEGGPSMFYKISKHLSEIKSEKIEEHLGIKIIKEVCEEMAKILLRNMELNVEKQFSLLEFGKYEERDEIIDNFSVIQQSFSNSCMVALTLLTVDDIIKAGKSVKTMPSN